MSTHPPNSLISLFGSGNTFLFIFPLDVNGTLSIFMNYEGFMCSGRCFAKCSLKLSNDISLSIFHTYRGNEFKNKVIDEIWQAFKIKRSLSKKGCSYDNAVAESSYKTIKTEFAFNRIFKSLDELKKKLRSYDNKCIHSSLNYMTPVEYRLVNMTE